MQFLKKQMFVTILSLISLKRPIPLACVLNHEKTSSISHTNSISLFFKTLQNPSNLHCGTLRGSLVSEGWNLYRVLLCGYELDEHDMTSRTILLLEY